MSPAKLQPALLGGLAIGVLSALPIIGWFNACCCAWVLLGGGLASYLMQQNHPEPIAVGDGALVGLAAGVIGAVVATVLSVPITMMMGPVQADFIERLLDASRDMPPEMRTLLENMRAGAVIGVALVLQFLLYLCLFSVFGLVGGMLGALVFRKNAPPPPPPGFGVPPPFAPPPPPPFTPPPPPGPPPGTVG